jgi:hypothetical protein
MFTRHSCRRCWKLVLEVGKLFENLKSEDQSAHDRSCAWLQGLVPADATMRNLLPLIFCIRRRLSRRSQRCSRAAGNMHVAANSPLVVFIFPQPDCFEQLLQEVCSQGMQQVLQPGARLFKILSSPMCNTILQADLEKLLLDFCETPSPACLESPMTLGACVYAEDCSSRGGGSSRLPWIQSQHRALARIESHKIRCLFPPYPHAAIVATFTDSRNHVPAITFPCAC